MKKKYNDSGTKPRGYMRLKTSMSFQRLMIDPGVTVIDMMRMSDMRTQDHYYNMEIERWEDMESYILFLRNLQENGIIEDWHKHWENFLDAYSNPDYNRRMIQKLEGKD